MNNQLSEVRTNISMPPVQPPREPEYAGIDWGMGQANIDTENNIRYGVISQHAVLQAWADESEPYYPNNCPHCGEDLSPTGEDELILMEGEKYPCCGNDYSDNDTDFIEATSFFIADETYQAECGERGNIVISKSKYYTFAQFCSPCYPGAGNLPTYLRDEPEANKTYCFHHDMFEYGIAPYPVYSVETGEVVLP